MPDLAANTQTNRLVGYFPAWANSRSYTIADIPAAQLTHIVYAFASVSADGDCVLANAKTDEANLAQLLALKRQHPKVMTLMSVGGAAHSKHFAAAAATAASRKAFAESCVRLMTRYGLDGVDIAWQFPSNQDKRRFTGLITELRRRLDAEGEADKRHYLLTIVAPPDPHRFAAMELNVVHRSVDWINLAAFDFTVASSATTNFNAPLFPAADDPAPAAARLTHNVDAAVKAYLEADVPAEKLVVGVHLAGIGWQGVPSNASNGLYQSNTGPAKGTWDAAGVPPTGVFGYQDIETNYLGTFTTYWHASAEVPWLYNATTGIMISYEDPQSLALKANYVATNKLGGVMVWELSADDAQHSLLGAFAGTIVPAAPFFPLAGATLSDTVLDNLKAGAPAQDYINDTLNTALRTALANAATAAGQTVLASLVQEIPAVDIAAQSAVTLHDFVNQQITLPADSADKDAATAAIAQLSTTATVGDLLGLDTPLEDNPLFATEANKINLNALLDTSATLAATPKLIEDFISAYAAFDGSIADFWTSLSGNAEFTAAIPELQLTLQLGSLTLGSPSLVAALRTRYPQMTSPSALVTVSVADWQQLITSQNVVIPASIAGATPAEQASNYAATIAGSIAEAFPGATFANALQQSLTGSQQTVDHAVAGILSTATDFDILNTNISSYIAEHGATIFAGVADTDQVAVTDRLATWQRVARVSSDFPTANTLLTAGYTSAYSIASTPRPVFLEDAADTVGSAAAAEAIFQRAQQISGTAKAWFINTRQALAGGMPQAIGDVTGVFSQSSSAPSNIPNWQELFGPLSSCNCDDCQSVYSAAAYFVDLLQFLSNSRKNKSSPSALDELLVRRPDLQYIKLNCVNTNTELPYVDLVNEIMEGFVVINNGTMIPSSGSTLPPGYPAHDTAKSATAADLSVSPEYTQDAAYNKHLNSAVYPPTLPFDRWLLTARTYLNFLSGSLYAIMAARQTVPAPTEYDVVSPSFAALANDLALLPSVKYHPLVHRLNVVGALSAPARALLLSLSPNANYRAAINELYTKSQAELANGTPSRIALACEYFNISEAECVILTGQTFAGAAPASLKQLCQYYGFPANTNGWEQSIASVENFQQNMAIAYDDLVALLQTRALNPKLSIMLLTSGTDQCDLASTTIADLSVSSHNLQDTTLDNFHRFIRLWRKLGWAISDLDKTMTALGASTIDQELLVELAAVQQIVSATGMPLLSVLSFWGAIDTDGRDSLYLSLFQNPAVINPPPPAFALIYFAPLDEPVVLEFPSPMFPNLLFTGGKLTLKTGTMSDAEFDALKLLSNVSNYTAAITTLHNATSVPTSVNIAALPEVILPASLYNSSTHFIGYVGAMPDNYRDGLNFSNEPAYQCALDAVYNMRTLFGAQLAKISTISDNVFQILAALRISAQDLAALRVYTKLAGPTAPLDLGSLTILTRYALLAQGLGLSVSDLLTAIALIGTDPFADQSPAATLTFVETTQAIQASPFTIAQLSYLFLDIYDANAGIAPAPADISLLLTTLQAGLAGIAAANAIIPDPKGALLAVALAKLLGTSLTTAAMGLITGSGIYSAPLAAVPVLGFPAFVSYNGAAQTLGIVGAMTTIQQNQLLALSDDPAYQAAVTGLYSASQAGGATTYIQPLPALPTLGLPSSSPTMVYDSAAQMLRVTGPITTAQETFLLALSGDANYQAAVQNLHQQPIDFINTNFSAFLDPNAAVTQLIETPAQSVAQQVTFVAERLMPYLTNVQCESLIKQTLSDNLSLNPQLCDLLLNSILQSQVIPPPPSPATAATAMSDYLALLGDGLAASYYVTADLSGTAFTTEVDATVDFDWAFGQPNAIPGRPFSVQWTGYVMPRYSETYTFYVQAGDATQLWIYEQGQPKPTNPLIQSASGGMPAERSGTVTLNAGQLYTIELDYFANAMSAGVTLSWSSASTPKTVVPQSQLFSALGTALKSLTPIVNSYILLFKTSLLVATFPLTAADVSYLYTNRKYFFGVNPDDAAATLQFDPNVLFNSPKLAPAIFNLWQRLNAIVALRNTLPGRDAGLLNIFATATASTVNQQGKLSPALMGAIQQATNWNQTDLEYLVSASAFNLSDANFTNELGTPDTGIVQLQSCVALMARLGISAEQFFNWASASWTSLTADMPTEEINARAIQNTVKAKYDDATWDTVGKPLNDTVREASKEALTAYILANAASWGLMAPDGGGSITIADQLYEYFLIDVSMNPCMLTSRIVQAAAAVQLFVQRCLMNLESKVSPSLINSQQWSWMQNFRVWQAAVMVLHYPEDWLVPTLRDDQTPLFQTFANTLLQNPITNDNVEQAYLAYLSGLDEISRLDIRATYWQLDSASKSAPDGTPDATNDVLHVFGRTTTKPYIYYYRRLLNCSQFGQKTGGAIWTPWEVVGVSIQADHLMPVVWDGRLYLFWPTFTLVTDPTAQGSITTPEPNKSYPLQAPAQNTQITVSWSEYWQGAWSSTSVSDPWVFENFVPPTPSDWGGFAFNTTIGADDSLTINIYNYDVISNSPTSAIPGVDALGQFTFAGCGGSPVSSQSIAWPLTAQNYQFVPALAPEDTWKDYNSWFSIRSGLTMIIGSIPMGPTQSGPPPTNPKIKILDSSPYSPNNPAPWPENAGVPIYYNLIFPQQFFQSFGCVAPSPFTNEPFFYQDSYRAYLVTEGFSTASKHIGDRTIESTIYDRGALTAAPSEANGTEVFASRAIAAESGTAMSAASTNLTAAVNAPAPTTPRSKQSHLHKNSSEPVLSQILFSNHFHPFACKFIKEVNQYGLPYLLTLANQQLTNDGSSPKTTVFGKTYQPQAIVDLDYPLEHVDFSTTGAYSIYNWELFFHIPVLIATQLDQNQQFDDAETWWRYVFNPTTSSTKPIPQRYWQFLPFYECSPADTIDDQNQNIFYPPSGSGPPAGCGQDIHAQIKAWRDDPFDPFVIARMRPVAFRMYVVMQYIQHHLSYGDFLFAQNTRESINEATMHYVLADELLGPQPQEIPERGTSQDYTYHDLVTLYGIDSNSNAMVMIENDFPYLSTSGASSGPGLSAAITMASPVPYFCFPPNDTLLGLWSTVQDRLYKIRNCMNIQGVVEQLPLFSPPISPALLVAAAAAGVSLSSVLSNTNAGTPLYRFNAMMQRAFDLCGEVRALGAALLAALEKQDAEALALLRATQETSLLQAMQDMKQQAVLEAQSNQASLSASLQTATDRMNYYTNLHSGSLSPQELQQQSALSSASSDQQNALLPLLLVEFVAPIPEFSVGINGVGGSPSATMSMGGSQSVSQLNATASQFQTSAGYQSYLSNMAGLQAQWNRRDAEWQFQAAQASDEMAQIQAQISAAGFRVTIAQDDQSNLNLQIQNAQQIQNYLGNKYTNTQLYSWMVSQISTVYFQCYQMAYNYAVSAEAALRFERGLRTSSYIQFGYWDSLKKGLMSGERLYTDLKRMEQAYLQTDVREYEITKPISLVLFDPFALISLKTTGQCFINLPEAFFDQDYPGHYFRRVKTVSLTIPCVTGPYTSVNCTMTLLNSKLRIDNMASSKTDFASDAHFITNYAATQSIATSTAQNDPGLFEINFHDERYLPFEGAGAISTWQIDLPVDCNAFDFDTITDVVINLRYTSRPGSDSLRDYARQTALLPARPAQVFNGSTQSFVSSQPALQRMFSLRHEFPTEWYKFLNPPSTATGSSMTITLGKDRFPFQYRSAAPKITKFEFAVLCADGLVATYTDGGQLALQLEPPGANAPPLNVSLRSSKPLLAGAPYGSVAAPQAQSSANTPPNWTLQFDGTKNQSVNLQFLNSAKNAINPAAVDDIVMICTYSGQGTLNPN